MIYLLFSNINYNLKDCDNEQDTSAIPIIPRTAAIGRLLVRVYQGRPVGLSSGTLRLALTYTMHNTQENGTYVDLFSQQVRKVDVFVFDEAGHFVQQITEEAAPKFAENYTKEIELPGGNYQFVVWGNHYEDAKPTF